MDIGSLKNIFSNMVAGSPIALDHAVIMMLLLTGLLSIRGKQKRYVPWVIIGGVVLSLFTPAHNIEPAWPILSALVLPPLLWQTATRLAAVRPVFKWQSILAWLMMTILIALALHLGGKLPLTNALLLGTLAASLVWQVRERTTGSTDLGTFGQLALALLLVEVDITLHPLGKFLGSLFSGAAFGLFLAFVGVRFASLFAPGRIQRIFYLILVYLAYLIGFLLKDISVVAMVVMMSFAIASYSYSAGLWPTKAEHPAPLTHGWILALLSGTWLMLGWQVHVPLSATYIVGTVLGLLAAGLGIFAGRWLSPSSDEPGSLLHKGWKVFLLILSIILLWPQEAILTPLSLAVALLAAVVVVLILRLIVYEFFMLTEMRQKWPDEPDI